MEKIIYMVAGLRKQILLISIGCIFFKANKYSIINYLAYQMHKDPAHKDLRILFINNGSPGVFPLIKEQTTGNEKTKFKRFYLLNIYNTCF